MGTTVNNLKIGETKIEIKVDSAGKFYAEFMDHTYSATTMDGLVEELRKVEKKSRSNISIPISLVNTVMKPDKWNPKKIEPEHGSERGIVHADFRGQHGHHYNSYMFTGTAGSKPKFNVGGGTAKRLMTRRLEERDIKEYIRLTGLLDAAQKAYDTWFESVSLEPDAAMKKIAKLEEKE